MMLRWTMVWSLLVLLGMGFVPAAAQSEGGALPTLDELLDLPAPKVTGESSADSLEQAGSSDTGFSGVVEDLSLAAGRLSEDRDAGIATQRLQERVVQRLNRIIAEATAQRASSSNQKPQDTGSESAAQRQQATGQSDNPALRPSPGSVEQEEAGDIPLGENLAEWGNLPPHLREALLEGRDDAYSRIWRRLTERYYKRLQEVGP